ncbi:MAG: hypothetical protein COV59_01225 [Candidatus Magasanikbacteria bacterium CG11_big_fil_rev_8_21_14_0_20_39_34]|uniref:Uncharacterized protein n=1 Tax=Candidatus Magasanikbacteria bacterium CG11_big_fil_rev_8_21_14_0_20_39_34 TaxID=1974653 RepID=A0A2H0N629_9BACT|nr:MAG: hypothetical protein COV59_01225 [Candidatus Magasanikbacteria bacterium CG11_big_fil_rev_8_21_14_0_20_39_34]
MDSCRSIVITTIHVIKQQYKPDTIFIKNMDLGLIQKSYIWKLFTLVMYQTTKIQMDIWMPFVVYD